MLFHLEDGCLVFLKLYILLLDLVHCNTDHIDHVSEYGSAHDFNQCDDYCLSVVVGREIAISNSDHGCIGPVIRVHVEDIPRLS